MKRDDLYDLAAFAVVAEKASFTRAAAELGMSQSALSHAIKSLEERMGVRLLSRTTRSVSVTDAGERLLRSLSPASTKSPARSTRSVRCAARHRAPCASPRPSTRCHRS